jgi:hypothetical protein
MRTTEGLTRLYMDSSVVSIPLTAAGTETGGSVLVALTVVEFVTVVNDVDVGLIVHPTREIAKLIIDINIHIFLFIVITPYNIFYIKTGTSGSKLVSCRLYILLVYLKDNANDEKITVPIYPYQGLFRILF